MATQSRFLSRRHMLSSVALTATAFAVALPSSALAQQASEASASDVIITGSRVISDGFSAPSPVTVVQAQQLLTNTPSTIGEALNKLPQFANSVRPTTSQFAPESGAATQLNLRSLGAQRSLILLDGRRVTPSTSEGVVDVSILPEELVQRVDIVTGGASAAYGSDAIAGVVNFVLDTKFKGIKANAQAGITQRGDNDTQKVSFAFGTNLGERLHIVGSASYFNQGGVRDYRDRDWFQSCAPLVFTGQTPMRVRTCGVKTPILADGGLVTGNVPFAGTQFGPGGTPQPFEFGNPLTSNMMVGGSGEDQGLDFTPVAAIERKTGYAHALYEASDSLDLYVDAMYGNSVAKFGGTLMGFYGNTSFTIYRDNAFLPDSIAQAMDAGVNGVPITQFTLGHTMRQTGLLRNTGESETVRFSGGFKAKLGGDWTLDGHYGYGTNLQTILAEGNLTIERVFDAVDAVRDGNGNIVCNRALTNPAIQGCIPYNVFGTDTASQAAIDYIRGSPYGGTGSRTYERTKQHVAEIVLGGTAFETWAGSVSVAVGAGYRKESVDREVDPGSDGLKFPNGLPRGVENTRYATSTYGAYFLSNQRPIVGGYDLWEVFGEALIPLADGLPFAQKLDLNVAARHTNYSTSGGVNTWKVGVNWQPIEDIRFRGTRSRDIRAPNLRELYSTSAAGASTAIDPFCASIPTCTTSLPVVVSQANGSTALTPEVADTLTVGAVFSPSFLPGFNISADYYSVKIDDAIGQLGVQNIIDQCFAGSTSLCPRLERAPNGVLFRVDNGFLNISERKTRGLDIEGSYRTNIGDGSFTLRAIASRVFELSTLTPGAPLVDRAGQVGLDTGVPDWTFNINATAKFGGFTASVDERIIGAGTYDATFVEGVSIDDNSVPAIAYTDVSLTYDIRTERGRNFQVYATINNLLDQAPPHNAGNFFVFATRPTNTFLYDQIGRAFTVGVRIQM